MKLKQLLMKNKKELSEGKRREEELQTTVSALQGLLEEEKQGSEQAKVEVSQVMAKIQSMKQKVCLENGVHNKGHYPSAQFLNKIRNSARLGSMSGQNQLLFMSPGVRICLQSLFLHSEKLYTTELFPLLTFHDSLHFCSLSSLWRASNRPIGTWSTDCLWYRQN